MIFISVSLIALFACSEFDKSSVFAPREQLSYAVDIKSILTQQCVDCHSGTQPAGSYDLSDFIGIFGSGTDAVPNAIPGDAQSLLVREIQSGGGMNGYTGSQENVNTLTDWIVADRLGLHDVNAHPAGWQNPGDTENFHGVYIRRNTWDFSSCKDCHGSNYEGGIAQSPCLTCHENTPENCNTCHGRSFRSSGAPPADVAGNVATTERGVGAHQTHLTGGALSEPLACSDCHRVPAAYDAPGHIDSSPHAELTWGALATTGGVSPEFTQDLTCRAVYCHGAFAAGEQNNAPAWTVVDGTQAACGTCHQLPPAGPTRNIGLVHASTWTQCSLCHAAVVDANNTIIDKSKHINGQVDQ